MAPRSFPLLRQCLAALRALLVLTVVLGVVYPLTLTGVAQLAFPGNADGSLVRVHGAPVGSDLVGQRFPTGGRGYFQGRPSAAGTGYDPLSTSASNLAADNPVLVEAVRRRRQAVARLNQVAPSRVPADALLSSGSGLDPHISPAYARLQVARVAHARGLSIERVSALVTAHTQGRTLGFLGEPRVNVLLLNLALDATSRGR